MRIRFSLLSLIILLALFGCYDIEEGTPECMVKNIKLYAKGDGCDDRSVRQYEFQGGIAFVMEPGTCGADMGADVFDEQCNLLGMLGGIAGNTTINGGDFSKAVFVQVVWQNKK